MNDSSDTDSVSDVRLVRLSSQVLGALGPGSNWAYVGSAEDWILVDGGYPGDAERVEAAARAAGFHGLPRAVLLTHAHADHAGGVVGLAERGVPVWCSREEADNATGRVPSQIEVAQAQAEAEHDPCWASWLRHALDLGGVSGRKLREEELRVFERDEELADLPGAPRFLPSTGHTPGHASYLIGGDAIVTGHPTAPDLEGPQMLHRHFHGDPEQALADAARLARTDGVRTWFPGHGEPVAMQEVREARLRFPG